MTKGECESYIKFHISIFKNALKVKEEFDFREKLSEVLDVYFMKQAGDKTVELCIYKNNKLIAYRAFRIISTKPNYGGKRYWFQCNNVTKEKGKCIRRVGTLYFDGRTFGCRHCLNLGYQSQKKTRRPIPMLLDELLALEKRYVRIYNSMVKTHHKGKPTKKMKILKRIEIRIKQLEPIAEMYSQI